MRSDHKSKVVLLAEQLRLQLQEKTEGKKRFKSAREIAREFSVSRQTADRALRLLAEEGALVRRPGAGTWKTGRRKTFRIACIVNEPFLYYPLERYSDLPERFRLLQDELEASRCEFEIFSIRVLRRQHFSPRLFTGYDALLADSDFNDPESRRLVTFFPGPKVWLAHDHPIQEPQNQVMSDFITGFVELFQEAQRRRISRLEIHLARPYFGDFITNALQLSGWQEKDYRFISCPGSGSQLSAYKAGLKMEVTPDVMHVCDLDITACGFYEAFLDRGLKPGDFALSGVGNIESLGFLPFGTACITTLSTPRRETVHAAVSLLLEELHNKNDASRIIRCPAHPVFRASAFGTVENQSDQP